MSDPKDSESFFRKVVRFVANPATDWADLTSRQDEVRETEMERSELKAMIERKRRNDFVRKREFDVLRKVRREGLSPEQLAALGGSSRIDDSEARNSEATSTAKQPDGGVKAKIDEIEQQMVGEGGFSPSSRRSPPSIHSAPTLPASLAVTPSSLAATERQLAPTVPIPLREGIAPAAASVAPAAGASAAAAPAVMGPGMSPLSPLAFHGDADAPDFANPFAVEVSEVAHDPELDEAVIAFANADFEQCEQSLSQLTRPGGSRTQHAETWLVLFDLYRAIGQAPKFEVLANDYAQQFGWSAPQWFSLPRLVAEAAAAEELKPAPARVASEVGWVCPDVLDADAVARLRSLTLQMPLPWVFDWSALRTIDPESCARLSELFRQWAGESLEMRWLGGEHFLTVLQDAAPTGVRDSDPAYWTARLDALRIINRPDQFDEAAIDYCVTYEVSPPSWERALCKVRLAGSNLHTQSPPLSVVSDVSTSFLESTMDDAGVGTVQVASVELSGQLVGDIGDTLRKLDGELDRAPIINVSCSKLIRVDFIAAGDLLNWVLARRGESRTVAFIDAHRLVALFFGAMGITEHAKVKVRVN
jgi:hypothetical protein